MYETILLEIFNNKVYLIDIIEVIRKTLIFIERKSRVWFALRY